MLCQYDSYWVPHDWVKNDIQISVTRCKVFSYHRVSLRVKQTMATAHTELEQQRDTRNYTPRGVRPLQSRTNERVNSTVWDEEHEN
jgi:hypothetical protein